MTRRILFYVPRNNNLRVVAPVIAHLVRQYARNVSIRVAFPVWPISKAELQPASEDFTRLFGDTVTCCPLIRPNELETVVRKGTDVIVTFMPEMAELKTEMVDRLRARSRSWGVTWVALPFVFNQDHFPLLNPDFVLRTWDIICTVGPASIRYVEEATRSWADAKRKALLSRLAVTGYPALDGIERLTTAAAIRQRYQLPSDGPIICVSPAPSFYPRVNSSRCARGLQARFRGTADRSVRGLVSRLTSYRYPFILGYRDYLSAIRRLAEANEAVVVAKTRVKHDDPPYVKDSVDRIVGDESFFPTSALELLSVSDLYVGFQSAMAVEAMALGVYSLTALIFPLELENPAFTSYAALFRRPGGVWNVPGVSESINGIGPTARAGLRKLERFPLGTARLDEARRLQFLADHFSWPCHASTRVAEILMLDAEPSAAVRPVAVAAAPG